MSITDLTPASLRRAAQIKEQIDALASELSSILSGAGSASSVKRGRPVLQSLGGGGRRQMSAAGRARIAAAARARWAKFHAAKGPGKNSVPSPQSSKLSSPGRRKMGPAARAKIAAAARARWAKVKASGRNAL
jgi:hypothetical protein